MNIAVFGASGEIGARLVQIILLESKENVLAFSRNKSPRLARWDKLNFISTGLKDKEVISEQLKGIDVVVNCAVDKGTYSSDEEAIEKNNSILKVILEASEAAGVKRFIHLSSIAVLPAKLETTHFENNIYNNDSDLYSRIKIETEKIILAHSGNMQCITLRPGIVYGPYMHWSKLIFTRLQNYKVILPSESNVCHAVHVDDLVRLILHLCSTNNTPAILYAINPELISWDDFFRSHGAYLAETDEVIIRKDVKSIQAYTKFKNELEELNTPRLKFNQQIKNLFHFLPERIRNSSVLIKFKNLARTVNWQINYADKEMPSREYLYPNLFELQLFQSDGICDSKLNGTSSGFIYKTSLESGTKSAGNWWNFNLNGNT